MTGQRSIGILALAGMVIVPIAAACSASSQASAQHSSQSASATAVAGKQSAHVSTAGCTDTSHANESATNRSITAGPFKENQGHWTSGAKLWVQTSHPEHGKKAVISAKPVSDAGKKPAPTRTRGPHQLATPEPPTGKPTKHAHPIFPGAYRLPKPGTWKLTVTIGSAHGCFLVDAG
jgi:hypothetical protein